MTFDALQNSTDQGAPLLLIQFQIGNTYWRYTSKDSDYVFNGLTWSAPPGGISRSAIAGTSDVRKQSIKITAARTLQFYQDTWASNLAPSTDVLVTIFMLHETDPDLQAVVDWIGRIKTPSRIKSTVVFTCEPVYAGVTSQGLRRCFGINCPHVHYGNACRLSADAAAINATLATVVGTAITSPEFNAPANLSFNGGFISWVAAFGQVESRSIVGWDAPSKTITIQYGHPELIAGLGVKIHPGCRHDLTDCGTQGNSLNYGGQPATPNINPMDGATPVF